MKKIISKNGYGILLDSISQEELEYLKENLTVKPIVLPDYDTGADIAFEVYRLSDKYIYVPKYYGLDKYGKPDSNKEREGPDINNLKFEGQLKDHQTEYCNTLLKEIKEKGSCISCSNTGSGKCEKINTPHIMFDGSVKMVQDIEVGDLLMGDDSKPRKVLSLGRGKDTMYEIIPTKGESYTFNSEHILSLKCTGLGIGSYFTGNQKNIKKWRVKYFDNKTLSIKNKSFETEEEAKEHQKNIPEESKICDISIKDYLKLSNTLKHILKLYRVSVEFPTREVPFDPYIIGLWIGDGNSDGVEFTSQDSAIVHYLANKLPKYNMYLQSRKSTPTSKYHYRMNGSGTELPGSNKLASVLRELDLINNKHIPDIYKINSRQVRLEILAGILDTDGHLCKNGGFEFSQKNEKIMDDVIYIARSLGFSAYKAFKKTSWTYKGIKNYGTAFRCHIYGNIEEIPCKIPRKQATVRKQKKDVLITGFKVVEKPVDDYYGFTLDGNHRYLLGNFTVTHNTTMALWLASQLKKKTLIVVHKQFLMDQWKERIAQFLPGVSIGVIKQNKCEIDKDIVIGMVQTIINRDYNFESFGLLIADEVHFMACRVFSKVLFKCKTKYALGLSATPNRQDGLTQVLEWFCGNIIINEILSDVEKPEIKIVEAEYSTDIVPKFNFKGTLNNANLVNQLVADSKRNKIIADEIIECRKLGRKILVLSGRREHCKVLRSMLPADTYSGLYLGGMDNEELTESNKADVIFATFAVASTGYDNPGLDTLVMATGMSNIKQSVGRILRRNNKNKPLVIDIIDKEFLYGQAKKRKQYYKTCGYTIIGEKIRKPRKTMVIKDSDSEDEGCLFE